METSLAHARLLALLREKSVRFGEFVLASGKTSDFYVDGRQTSLHVEGAYLIATLVLARMHPETQAVGGMTMGADPIACATAAVSFGTSKPVHGFLIRKTPKGHGAGQSVEGMANLPAGTPVTMVEDTTTTGGSLLRAIELAEEAGLRVVQCITVVDREEGAKERLAEAGYVLEALTCRSELAAS